MLTYQPPFTSTVPSTTGPDCEVLEVGCPRLPPYLAIMLVMNGPRGRAEGSTELVALVLDKVTAVTVLDSCRELMLSGPNLNDRPLSRLRSRLLDRTPSRSSWVVMSSSPGSMAALSPGSRASRRPMTSELPRAVKKELTAACGEEAPEPPPASVSDAAVPPPTRAAAHTAARTARCMCVRRGTTGERMSPDGACGSGPYGNQSGGPVGAGPTP